MKKLYSASKLLKDVKGVDGWKDLKVNLRKNEVITRAWPTCPLLEKRIEGPCAVWVGETPTGEIYMEHEKDAPNSQMFMHHYNGLKK